MAETYYEREILSVDTQPNSFVYFVTSLDNKKLLQHRKDKPFDKRIIHFWPPEIFPQAKSRLEEIKIIF